MSCSWLRVKGWTNTGRYWEHGLNVWVPSVSAASIFMLQEHNRGPAKMKGNWAESVYFCPISLNKGSGLQASPCCPLCLHVWFKGVWLRETAKLLLTLANLKCEYLYRKTGEAGGLLWQEGDCSEETTGHSRTNEVCLFLLPCTQGMYWDIFT